MNLAALQEAFQRHVLAGERAIVGEVSGDGRFAPEQRLAVYRHAYRARLASALSESHRAVRFALGEDRFAALARAFVELQPSQFASIRWYGAGFGAFLASQIAGVEGRGLRELARWEWTLGLAFDAADAVPIATEALAAVAPDAWGRLRFGFLPSLQRTRLATNALAWWRAALEQAPAPGGWQVEPATEWVVWRRGLATSFRSLAGPEAAALDAALAGATFGALCEHVAAACGAEAAPLRAAALLKGWFAEGWVIGIDVINADHGENS
ncbi:MAG TPA: DNA-binding domain-containing protein [Steroidobacteraceae bacterium]|nr:DNA-binding domain-containing protein [Steroidobacteraceae bacterium]